MNSKIVIGTSIYLILSLIEYLFFSFIYNSFNPSLWYYGEFPAISARVVFVLINLFCAFITGLIVDNVKLDG